MCFQDKSIRCSDCGAVFTFSAGEQQGYESRGYAIEPGRCPACRQARRLQRSDAGDGGPERRMYSAVCAACGQEGRFPFDPRGNQPAYCSDCLNKMRPGR